MTDHNREELIERATWTLIDYDTDVVDRGVRDEHYRERRADVERVWAVFEQAHTVQDSEEPEWAVSVAREVVYGDPLIYDFPDRLAAERFIKNPPLWFSREDNQTKTLVRRRKAGPWLPVEQEGETDDQNIHDALTEDIQAYLVMDGIYLDHSISSALAQCLLTDPDWFIRRSGVEK